MDKSKRDTYYQELCHVTTVREVCWLYNMTVDKVYRWLNEGKLYGVKSQGTWLISMSSVQDEFGKPVRDIKELPTHDLQKFL